LLVSNQKFDVRHTGDRMFYWIVGGMLVVIALAVGFAANVAWWRYRSDARHYCTERVDGCATCVRNLLCSWSIRSLGAKV